MGLGLIGFVALLVASHTMNLVSPPPPSVEAMGYAGLGLGLFPLLAWWFDRHRRARNLPA